MDHYGINSRPNGVRTEHYYEAHRERWDAQKVFVTLTCEWCGKQFTVESSKKNVKYCCEDCRKQSVAKQYRDGRTEYYCQLCGEKIEYGDRVYPRKYCDSCHELGLIPKIDTKIERQCGWCGKTVRVIPSSSDKHKYVYCDIHCMAKHYRERFSAENSPTWKGGKSHHYGGHWRAARKAARNRDHYTCQLCGITEEEYGQEMSVHHIRNYRLFSDKEEANKLENLVCLCEPCHRFVHSNMNVDGVYIQNQERLQQDIV